MKNRKSESLFYFIKVAPRKPKLIAAPAEEQF